jgi:NAD(P)-dependent dehydrogenase (short-subunit alcohol dehydrogenase family)
MRGRVCLITGASSGLGLETALGLARAGADLILVCRDPRRGVQARERIAREAPDARVDLHLADFETLASVRALARTVLSARPALHVLVNNAGALHETWRRTADGFEATWQVNHLAPFLLTNLLLQRLIAGAPARIVTVASASHLGAATNFETLDARAGYSMLRAYGRSKLANVLFALELARRLEGTGVTSNCLHPGMVATQIGNRGGVIGLAWELMKPFLRTPSQGAETTLYLAASPEAAHLTGGYFIDRRMARPDPIALDRALQTRLWELSARMVELTPAGG